MSTLWYYVHLATPWLWYASLIAASAAGLFLNILGLPGLWLIVIAAVVYAWWFGFAYIGWYTIGVLVALGVLAEAVEFVAGAAGSRRAGGSKRGMVGAIVGGLVGGLVGTVTLPVPVLGTVVGSVVGCFIGTYPVEYAVGRTHREAALIGFGAAKGRVFGLVLKTVFGLAMALVAAVMGVPIGRSASPAAPATQPVPSTWTATATSSARVMSGAQATLTATS